MRSEAVPAQAPASLQEIPLAAVRAAQGRIAPHVVRTPLVRLPSEAGSAGAGREIYLKLENIQPTGSFKLRGAANALLQADPAELRAGVWTASAGNMAQGVALCARKLGVACRVVVPAHAPAAKTEAVERLGAALVRVPFAEWWNIIETRRWNGARGHFVHPVCDARVIAGNATIGLEIAQDLPDVDTVVVPFGGGGLSCGIASALSETVPNAKVYAAEVATAAPFAASLAAGRATTAPYTATFVDGIGSRSVLQEMWPLASRLLAGSKVVSVRQIAQAIRLIAQHTHTIAEGAGAAALAAILAGNTHGERIVCVVSGGNLDVAVLVRVLAGEIP
ncbi:MAG: threonine ammonia-lyase [Gemmatimonadaceae bacterium]